MNLKVIDGSSTLLLGIFWCDLHFVICNRKVERIELDVFYRKK